MVFKLVGFRTFARLRKASGGSSTVEIGDLKTRRRPCEGGPQLRCDLEAGVFDHLDIVGNISSGGSQIAAHHQTVGTA